MNLLDAVNFANADAFATEEKCIAYLESLRWPDGVNCPNCGNHKISRIHSRGRLGKVRRLYQCLEKNCRYQFSPTTGTIFHDSHLPLQKWFVAISKISASETVSVNQLRHVLGVQYKTAQHVVERIREARERGTVETSVARKMPVEVREVPLAAMQPAIPAPSAMDTKSVRAPAGVAVAETGSAAFTRMLDIFTSVAQFTIRSPWYAANFIIEKVSVDT